MKIVIVMLLIKSANILPIIGTNKYALIEGTNLSVRACILAIGAGGQHSGVIIPAHHVILESTQEIMVPKPIAIAI